MTYKEPEEIETLDGVIALLLKLKSKYGGEMRITFGYEYTYASLWNFVSVGTIGTDDEIMMHLALDHVDGLVNVLEEA